MKNLTEVIETLTQINRYEELKTILKDWATVYNSPFIGQFEVFEMSLYPLKRSAYYTSNKISLNDLKEDYKHFKDIMDISYPKKRELNKIAKEYNLLVAKFDRIDVKYLTEKLSETTNNFIEDSNF